MCLCLVSCFDDSTPSLKCVRVCRAFPSLSVYVAIVFLQLATRVAFRQPRPSDGLAKGRRGRPNTSSPPLPNPRTLPFVIPSCPGDMSSYPHRHAQTNTLTALPPLFIDPRPVCLFFFPEKKEPPPTPPPPSGGYLFLGLPIEGALGSPSGDSVVPSFPQRCCCVYMCLGVVASPVRGGE